VGLGPFVETLPTSGKVGSTVEILGEDLTGTTSVTFNGVAATFTVESNTAIKTTVPSGATTGLVTLTTLSGTLKSNVRFQVRP
jgi:large repetitive protein